MAGYQPAVGDRVRVLTDRRRPAVVAQQSHLIDRPEVIVWRIVHDDGTERWVTATHLEHESAPTDLTEVTDAAGAARDALAHRDHLIRCAHRDGASLRTIAEAAGVSHQTVANIVRGSGRGERVGGRIVERGGVRVWVG